MITSFRHDKQKRREQQKLLGYLLLFFFILFIFHSPISRVLSPFFFNAAGPVMGLTYSAKAWWNTHVDLFASKEVLIAENQHLKNALDAVALEAYSREQLRDENEQIKSVLGRHSARAFVLARVLATPGQSPYDTLLLDVGSVEGVTSGMKVFVDGDFVIGEIGQVTEHGSVATLYSSYGNELPVTLVGTSSIPAIAKGEGGGNFRMTLPRGVAVLVGDLVHIPAIAPEYIGVVAAVDRLDGGSLQDVYLAWPFNAQELTWVYVLVTPEISSADKRKR